MPSHLFGCDSQVMEDAARTCDMTENEAIETIAKTILWEEAEECGAETYIDSDLGWNELQTHNRAAEQKAATRYAATPALLAPTRTSRPRERRPACSSRVRGSRRGHSRSCSRGGDSGDDDGSDGPGGAGLDNRDAGAVR